MNEPALEDLKENLRDAEEAIDTIYKVLKSLIPIADQEVQYGRHVILNIVTQLGGETQFLEVRSLGLRRMIDDLNKGLAEPIPNGDVPF